ncbi:ABC transporter substrate-binding protein [Rariglobus hedericola]|uniref:Extracellular solute-binding protein n=1 Tax=Rariglobus hedericola TaxID=2597822 RepID=A0A556QS39_9BACT|nr:extracellular solute-binding protein [Rariglobus hedericola]TSJ79457.1 extracellular solute-binding protein [Rariglobus hedericola]
MSRQPSRFKIIFEAASPAVWVLLVIAVLTTLYVWQRPARRYDGLIFWTSARAHTPAYAPLIETWNRNHPVDSKVNMLLLDYGALERRMLSGFLSGTPVSDLIEVERNIAGRAFTGPVEDVGFIDLTDRLRNEGLLEKINAPSFGAWTSRGRIFGLPHDVHPVLLAYRADIVEAAGIDVSTIETWDDLIRAFRPLMKDFDGDGRPDRFILNFWPTNADITFALLLQAGGQLFDEHDRPVIDSEINARVITTLATWSTGSTRISVDAPEFSAAGNQLRLQGTVIASVMPDWLAGVWKIDLPALSGKIKLMPLPAWTPGGRRTSAQGGSMLGIPKTSRDPEACWAFAKELYLSPQLAAESYRALSIVTPVKQFWSLPVFDEPDAYFAGQPAGRLFINQAPNVPVRSSSPYGSLAMARINDAMLSLVTYIEATGETDVEKLLPETRRLLAFAQAQVVKQIDRNVFLRPATNAEKPAASK